MTNRSSGLPQLNSTSGASRQDKTSFPDPRWIRSCAFTFIPKILKPHKNHFTPCTHPSHKASFLHSHPQPGTSSSPLR
ncbi:hypothetical protein L596_029918 [Steinernema carpocapsae]|uniref:Uncharacterized protein n=1 Tax=Steinernema carpocapsae TaxID=34508 RepID=A0A4U5LR80_STECR|nr:hypothetical protein L596_029918 [Steinernema carpocapsae]